MREVPIELEEKECFKLKNYFFQNIKHPKNTPKNKTFKCNDKNIYIC